MCVIFLKLLRLQKRGDCLNQNVYIRWGFDDNQAGDRRVDCFFQDHLYNYSSQGVKAKRGLVTIDNNVIVIV